MANISGFVTQAAPAAMGGFLPTAILFAAGVGVSAIGSYFTGQAQEEDSRRNFQLKQRELDLAFKNFMQQSRNFKEKMGLERDQFNLLVKQTNQQLGLDKLRFGLEARAMQQQQQLQRQGMALQEKQLAAQTDIQKRQLWLQGAKTLADIAGQQIQLSRLGRAGAL